MSMIDAQKRRRRQVLLTMLGGGSYANQILNVEPSSIIESWALSETAGTTAVGAKNGINGTYSSGVTLNAITFPDGTPAPLFDASAENVQLPAASLNTPFDEQLGTMFLWLKVRAASVWTDGVSRIAFSLGVDANNRIFFNKSSVSNRFDWFYNAGGTSEQRILTSFSPTTWMSMAITWNKASDRVRVYLNGVQQGADLTTLGVWAGSLANSFCFVSFSGANFWDGYIKYPTAWNAELTAAQLLALSPAAYQV